MGRCSPASASTTRRPPDWGQIGRRQAVYRPVPELRVPLRKPAIFELLHWSSAGCHKPTITFAYQRVMQLPRKDSPSLGKNVLDFCESSLRPSYARFDHGDSLTLKAIRRDLNLSTVRVRLRSKTGPCSTHSARKCTPYTRHDRCTAEDGRPVPIGGMQGPLIAAVYGLSQSVHFVARANSGN